MMGGRGIHHVKKVLRRRDGNSTPTTVALVLGLLLCICAMAEFFRLLVIVQGVRDGVQQAVVAVMTTNYDEAYNGLREGYSGGYRRSGSQWVENLDYSDVYHRRISCWEPVGREVIMSRCRHRRAVDMSTVFRGFLWKSQTHRSRRETQAGTWRRM